MIIHVVLHWLFCFAIIHPVYTLLSSSPNLNNGYILSTGRIRRSRKTTPLHSPSITSIFTLPPTLESLVTDTLDADRKIVVVTGGVLSGIGKGVTASSIGVVSMKLSMHLECLSSCHVHSVH